MGRYQIALNKKPVEIKIEKPKRKIPRKLKQSHFTDIKVMLDFMHEKGGDWVPVCHLYYEEIPLVAYRSENEIVLINAEDLNKTEDKLDKSVKKAVRSEKPLKFTSPTLPLF